MKKILCSLIALAMALSLAACGGQEKTSVFTRSSSAASHDDAGYYTIFSITEDDETLTQDMFVSMGWNIYLQLDEDGTGILDLDDGDATSLTWEDGSVTTDGETISYSLAGGMLTLDLSDEDGSFVMVFQKTEPDALPAAAAEAQADADLDLNVPAPVDMSGSETVGTYKLTAMEGEESATDEDLKTLETLGLTCELVMDVDGTGALVLFGEAMDLTWDETGISADGETLAYSYEDGVLSISEDDTTLVFTKYTDEVIYPAPSEDGDFDPDALDLEDAGLEGFGLDESEEQTEPHEIPALPEGDFEPVGSDIGSYHVEIVGAEAFTDENGEDAVRFYYDFTNNSDELVSAWYPLYLTAEEDGFELDSAYAPWDERPPESSNADKGIEPGVTIRCTREYALRPDGTVLAFYISDYYNGPLTAVFDVSALPGRPAEDLEIIPIEDPQFYADYPSSAASDNIEAEIVDTSIVTDYATDGDALRVVFSVTNNTDETQSPLWMTTVRAFQDGIELDSTYTEDEDGLENVYYDDVEAGATTQFAYAWTLRGGSPVEVTLQDTVDFTSEDVLIADTVTLD